MSPLRRRMIDDMQIRNLTPNTQRVFGGWDTGRERLWISMSPLKADVRWRVFAEVATVAAVTLGSMSALFTSARDPVARLFGENPAKQIPETLENRISRLTKSLNDSATLISNIEREIGQRQQLVAQLQTDADEAEKLKALNAAQLAAVAQAIHAQLETQSRSDFWPSMLRDFFFAGLGAAFGEAFRWFRERHRSPE